MPWWGEHGEFKIQSKYESTILLDKNNFKFLKWKGYEIHTNSTNIVTSRKQEVIIYIFFKNI